MRHASVHDVGDDKAERGSTWNISFLWALIVDLVPRQQGEPRWSSSTSTV